MKFKFIEDYEMPTFTHKSFVGLIGLRGSHSLPKPMVVIEDDIREHGDYFAKHFLKEWDVKTKPFMTNKDLGINLEVSYGERCFNYTILCNYESVQWLAKLHCLAVKSYNGVILFGLPNNLIQQIINQFLPIREIYQVFDKYRSVLNG